MALTSCSILDNYPDYGTKKDNNTSNNNNNGGNYYYEEDTDYSNQTP